MLSLQIQIYLLPLRPHDENETFPGAAEQQQKEQNLVR